MRRPQFGIFCKSFDPGIIEPAASVFDFLIFDMEHGPLNRELLTPLIISCNRSRAKAIVRVPENNKNMIGSVLDLGADAVQIPNINSLNEAKSAVEAAKFSPAGSRGVCRYVRAANYGQMPSHEYFEKENRKQVILQIEGERGFDDLSSIMSVRGVDVLFVGPYDLSASLGVPGEIEHPIVTQKINSIKETAVSSGIQLGIFVDEPKHAIRMVSLGFDFIACSVDVGIWAAACVQLRNELGA